MQLQCTRLEESELLCGAWKYGHHSEMSSVGTFYVSVSPLICLYNVFYLYAEGPEKYSQLAD